MKILAKRLQNNGRNKTVALCEDLEDFFKKNREKYGIDDDLVADLEYYIEKNGYYWNTNKDARLKKAEKRVDVWTAHMKSLGIDVRKWFFSYRRNAKHASESLMLMVWVMETVPMSVNEVSFENSPRETWHRTTIGASSATPDIHTEWFFTRKNGSEDIKFTRMEGRAACEAREVSAGYKIGGNFGIYVILSSTSRTESGSNSRVNAVSFDDAIDWTKAKTADVGFSNNMVSSVKAFLEPLEVFDMKRYRDCAISFADGDGFEGDDYDD